MNMKFWAGSLGVGLSVMALHAEVKVELSKLPPAATKTGVTFDSDIKPIFEKACAKCHGAEVEKPKGKFRSDTAANVIKGGGEGPSVTPGDLAKSPIIAMVAHITEDEELYMPPKDNKAKIAAVDQGRSRLGACMD